MEKLWLMDIIVVASTGLMEKELEIVTAINSFSMNERIQPQSYKWKGSPKQ